MKITVLEKCSITKNDITFDELDSLGNVEYYDILRHEEIIDKCRDSEILLCNKSIIDNDIIENCGKLKLIVVMATGYNNIDISVASKHDITVCNVPGYSGSSVAQLVFSYILHFANSLDVYNRSVHAGDWVKSKQFTYFPYPLNELKDKILGIYGLGNIGTNVANIGNAFGMNVISYTRTKKTIPNVTMVEEDELFKKSDFLTIHCPLTEQTSGLVCMDKLKTMKKTAVLINTSRGGVINEGDLVTALKKKIIAGAALDVLDKEPMKSNHPFMNLDNCIITPHIGWATLEARERLMDIVIKNISSFMNGNVINKVN